MPRPYGVTKKPSRRSRRSTSVGSSRKAIEGRPLTRSKAANVLVPARKFGWPHDDRSEDSGNARHKARRRRKVRSVPVSLDVVNPSRATEAGRAPAGAAPRVRWVIGFVADFLGMSVFGRRIV